MKKLRERLLIDAEKIYRKYEAGLIFFQDAKDMISELRDKCIDEHTDQSLFEYECDLDELFANKLKSG